MIVENYKISRGNIHILFENKKIVYIPGELTMLNKFYASLYDDWFWIKSSPLIYTSINNLDIVSTVNEIEKSEIIKAVNEFNKQKELKVIFD